jgi:hypothetical protein
VEQVQQEIHLLQVQLEVLIRAMVVVQAVVEVVRQVLVVTVGLVLL